MPKPDNAPSENFFVTRRLPWWIGGGALLFYLITLNHWLSLESLGTIARLTGWQWQPEVGRPLTLAFFAPLKLLPVAWLPGLANFLTAMVAALVLQQLARSVAILRQDIAPEDRLRKKQLGPMILTGPLAWLPPGLAVLALGLQRDFWEHATAASGAMLSLLCFAAAFRCVLEFRLTPQDRWLYRASFCFALGMTDHWLMVGYLPAFVAAIIWAKGYWNCLAGRFLTRMTGAAALGLSLYLLNPILLAITAPEQWGFWTALKAELGAQKQALQLFRLPALRLLLVTAPLPFVLLAVKWRAHTVQLADDTHLGIFFSKASGHFIHALFLLAALWLALEPAVVPPVVARPTLLLYQYTWALVAGHCAGYLLLFGRPASARHPVRWPAGIAWVLLLLLPAGLLWKNLADVRLTNGGALREFARQLGVDLPAGSVTALSDEPAALFLVQAELTAQGRGTEVLLVDTRLLPWLEYHEHLHRRFGARWPEVAGTNRTEAIAPAQLRVALRQHAATEPLVYLQPSSGLLVEDFIVTAHGWSQRLAPRPAPPAAPDLQALATNEARWQTRWAGGLATRATQFSAARARAARWTSPTFQALKFSKRNHETAAWLAAAYAKMLNHWGVQAQQAGLAGPVGQWFQRALEFDPDNLAARINQEFITRQQRGDTQRLTLGWLRETHPKLIAQYERWTDVISRGGPVDEPTFLFHTGRMYLAAGNPHQARDAFARSVALAGEWLAPRLAQAQCENMLGNYAAALTLTTESALPNAELKLAARIQWMQARATALWRTGQTNETVTFINTIAAAHREQPMLLVSAADFFAAVGRHADELAWREIVSQLDPKRLEWLILKGHAELRTGQAETAIATLTQALTLEPTSARARLFRAIAALRAGQLEAARQDYEKLLAQPATAPSALFGLGGISWRTRDTNAMIQYYQAFLTNTALRSPQAALANQRLKDWQDE